MLAIKRRYAPIMAMKISLARRYCHQSLWRISVFARFRVRDPAATKIELMETGVPAARRGLMVIFAVDGALFASWASRLPQVQDDIGADAASLGLALGGTAIGALTAMSITGVISVHHSPFRVACVTLLCLCLSMVLPGLRARRCRSDWRCWCSAPCYGATDVAMNSAGRPVGGGA